MVIAATSIIRLLMLLQYQPNRDAGRLKRGEIKHEFLHELGNVPNSANRRK